MSKGVRGIKICSVGSPVEFKVIDSDRSVRTERPAVACARMRTR
jgi:hypothetical protein